MLENPGMGTGIYWLMTCHFQPGPGILHLGGTYDLPGHRGPPILQALFALSSPRILLGRHRGTANAAAQPALTRILNNPLS